MTYMIGCADALVYIFQPQLATLVLQGLQGRPLLHRMMVRSAVIGDRPWVAQKPHGLKVCSRTPTATPVAFYTGKF